MIEPVVKEVVVEAEPERAFRWFTEGLGEWWPRATHSVYLEECASTWMEPELGGRLMERSGDGEEAEWGRITRWAPPGEVAFTWHPGRTPDTAQEVAVTFVAEGTRTRVRLVHAGWDRFGDGAEEMRDAYDGGWTPVLGEFVSSLTGAVR